MVQENNYNRMQSLRTVGAGINIGNYAIGDATPEECLELLLENPDVNILTDAEYVLLGSFVSLTPANDDFFQFKAGAWANRTIAQVKADLAINNVDNTSDLAKPLSTASINALALKADLVAGKVPSSQLPSYVDDVEEYANFASFPVTGETGKLYIAINTGFTYRWSGSIYVLISNSLVLGETSIDAYRGDRGKIAYDHSQLTHDKAFVGLGNVDNTSDANKPVSTAQQTALNLKVSLAGNETITGQKWFNLSVADSDIKIGDSLSIFSDTVSPSYLFNAELVSGIWKYMVNGRASMIQMNAGTGNLDVSTAPTGIAGGAITWTLAHRIQQDGVVSLPIGQLKFPSTPNPSADANTLDDYKTNMTWTPVDASGAGLSFTVTNARATKIGDMVSVWGDITYPATADTSVVRIGGVPYAPSLNTGAVALVGINPVGMADFEGYISSGSQILLLNVITGLSATNAQLSGRRFLFSITYFV